MLSARLSNAVRKMVYRRDGWACVLCDSRSYLQIHHVVPRSEGGANQPPNLVTLCSRCHAQIHGDLPPAADWLTPPDMVQACVEYLADYYTDAGCVWDPYDE